MARRHTHGSSAHAARELLGASALAASPVISGLSAQAGPAPSGAVIGTMAASRHSGSAGTLPPHNLLLCDGASVPSGGSTSPPTALPSVQAGLTG